MMDPPVLPLLHRRQSASPSGSPSRNPSLWSVIWSLILGFWGILVHWVWSSVTYCWQMFWGVVTFCWNGFWKGVGVVWNGVTGGLVYVWRRCIRLGRAVVFLLDEHKEYVCGFVAAIFAGLATVDGVKAVCVFVIPDVLDTDGLACFIVGVIIGLVVSLWLVGRGGVYLRGRLMVLEARIGARVLFYANKWEHKENIIGGLFYGMLSGMLMCCSYWITNVLLGCDPCDPGLEDCRPDLERFVSFICLSLAWMSASFNVGERPDGADGASERVGGADGAGERVGGADGAGERVGGADGAGERVGGARYRAYGVSGCLTFIPIGMVLQSQWISWPHFLMGFPTTSVSEVMIMPLWNFLLECARKSEQRHALLS